RGAEAFAKGVPQGGHAPRLRLVAEHSGQEGGVADRAHRPEIVPVGVHGMREVAFMAGRFRQEAVTRALLRRLVLGPKPCGAQCLEVAHGLRYGRPQLLHEPAIPGETEAFGDREDELTVAVVLDEPVRPVPIHDAGDGAIRCLVCGVPANELLGLAGASHAQECRRHDGAVADPRPRVAARPWLCRGSRTSTRPSFSAHSRTAVSNASAPDVPRSPTSAVPKSSVPNGIARYTSRADDGGRSRSKRRAAEAWPNASVTCERSGSSPRRMWSVIGSCSNAAAPNPSGSTSGITARVRLIQTTFSTRSTSVIGLTPPSAPNDCHGGVTW